MYPLYDPSQGGKPKIGQPYLFYRASQGTGGKVVHIDIWKGELPQGDRIVTKEEGIQLQQDRNQDYLNAHTSGPGYAAPAANKTVLAQNQQYLNEIQSLNATAPPLSAQQQKDSQYYQSTFKADATDPSIANFTPEAKAAYVSPEQGLADSLAKAGYSSLEEFQKAGNATMTSPQTTTLGTATPQNLAVSGGTSKQPPSVNLQPGATGAAVKQLQDYLVSIGAMTQEQVNTGYGTYGPQTTAAVKALQQQYGVDNSTGPGYWGPRTIAAVQGSQSGGGGTPSIADPDLQAILNNPNLAEDQKQVIQSIYDAVTTNDADTAERLQAAMKAASEFSSPYFKAQISLAVDALNRGLKSQEGDLAFEEQSLQNTLKDLQDNLAASRDYLSFQHQQELGNLAKRYEADLTTTRENMAATGFTTSTKRARAEQLLSEENQGLVESSNKGLSFQTGNLQRQQTASERDTAAQIANLQRLAAEGKLNLYRQGEEAVGTKNLPTVSGLNPLGGVGGSIPRQQATDAFSFASNFVF